MAFLAGSKSRIGFCVFFLKKKIKKRNHSQIESGRVGGPRLHKSCVSSTLGVHLARIGSYVLLPSFTVHNRDLPALELESFYVDLEVSSLSECTVLVSRRSRLRCMLCFSSASCHVTKLPLTSWLGASAVPPER